MYERNDRDFEGWVRDKVRERRLEIDPDAGQVLIRSTPPAQQLQGSKFYEMLLQSQTDGQFSLRRYLTEKGRPGRTQVDIQTTHEVLDKLLNDLVDTIPSDP